MELLLLVMILLACSYPQPAMSRPHNNFTDLDSLLAFKASIVDPYRILATNWTKFASFCSWIGVGCSRRGQRVSTLILKDINLQGTIAPHLANLSFLSYLLLSNNTLSGPIPDAIGRMPRLAVLGFQNNHLSGSIPSSIFNMSSLITLSFYSNNLSGSLPSNGVVMLPNLQFITLSYNQLTGKIPSFSRCLRIRKLGLSFNEFTQTIPIELGNITGLKLLSLSTNKLTGTIPASLGNLTALETLDLSMNYLEGVIPKELGTLLELQYLSLDVNSLTGSIPMELLNASNINFVQLAVNNLTGIIPTTVGKSWPQLTVFLVQQNKFTGGADVITSLTNCKNLTHLDMSQNQIQGALPNSIGNLSATLEYFSSSQNFMDGRIPAGIGNLSSLLLLDFELNMFSGEIPSSLSGLKRLEGMGLNYNKLRGYIPSELGQMISLLSLFLQSNMLSGPIPDSFGNLSNLQHLEVDGNNLVSEIPNSLWSLRGLISLRLAGNSLDGQVSKQVGNLKSLDLLDLSNNMLSGNISSDLGDLQMITYLDISNNSFQGQIPQSLGRLINIKYLNMSFNFLSGSIPKSLAELRYLGSLDLSFNKLDGEIPEGRVFSNLSIPSLKGNTALCGAIRLGFSPCPSNVTTPNSNGKLHLLKYILPSLASVIIMLSCFYLLLVVCRKRIKHESPSQDIFPNNLRVISYYELVRGTDNFSDANLLGRGSVSSVFKALLDDGLITAVKVFNLEDQAALKSFNVECDALSKVRHKNLVKIISACSNLDFKALVMQFMSNGSLEQWLYSQTCYLNLVQRINIMVDVSVALEYLHHHNPDIVLHRDLKPSNVLLDENMMAHVADFGIAKLLHDDQNSKPMSSTNAAGTIGYMAPEYGSMGKASRKADVYSFGILLLETLTRKRPSDPMFSGELSLKQWVSDAFPDAVFEIVDSSLLKENSMDELAHEMVNIVCECLSSMIELGLACSRESQKERPLMKDVVPKLQKIQIDYLSKLPSA